MDKEIYYLIPESQLFRLLTMCSNLNFCTKKHITQCKCREITENIPTKDSNPIEESPFPRGTEVV